MAKSLYLRGNPAFLCSCVVDVLIFFHEFFANPIIITIFATIKTEVE